MGSTTALLLFSVLGTVLSSLIQNHFDEKRYSDSQAHDINMANLQKQNEIEVQKTMFDYQNNFNSWANNKSQMVEAGQNPALMYGGSSSPVTFGATGSSSASATSPTPKMDLSRAFRSIDPFEVASNDIARMNANTNADVGASVIKKNEADALRASSETARNTFDLGLRKRMENTIVDQALANLERTSAESAEFRSRTKERDTLLGSRKLQLDRENQKLLNEIEREPLVRQRLQADTFHLRSLAHLASEQATSEGYKRSQIVSDIRYTEERLKGSELERIMKMSGISKRHKDSDSYRLVDAKGNYVATDFTNQEKQAFAMLVNAGYSLNDATTAVLYYSGVEPKDLTPSIINGASRVLAGLPKFYD